MKCKNCGAELVLMSVPANDRHPEGSQAVPACSVCGSRDYQDVTVDQMQVCWHGNVHHLTTGPYYATGGALLEDCTKYKQRITALESMLRELEWVDSSNCPTCGYWGGLHGEKDHDPDCRLKKLLEES